MQHRLYRFILLLGVVASRLVGTSAAFAASPVSLPVEEHTLPNGLRVLLAPDPRLADVSVLVRYDVGAGDEPAGLNGIAHLVEHLMFAGSKHVPHGELFRSLVRAGGTNINGTTSSDSTEFFETIPTERLELALWLESDRMGYLLDSLDESGLARERASVLNEYRERVTDPKLGSVDTIVWGEIFPGWHPYHRLPVGSQESIGRISLELARSFVGTWYTPSNAVLVLAGRFEPEQAMSLVTRYFATLPSHPPPVRPFVPAYTPLAQARVHVGAEGVAEKLHIAWVTPHLGEPGDRELDIAATILTGGGTGWLSRRLVNERHLAWSVSAAQHSMRIASIFEIDVTLVDGQKMEEVLNAIDNALARFDTGVGADEMRRAQVAWYNRRLFGLESSFQRASRLAMTRALGPLVMPYDWGLGAYATITPEGVRSAVARHLTRGHRIITLIHNVKGMPRTGAFIRREELQ